MKPAPTMRTKKEITIQNIAEIAGGRRVFAVKLL
jgi:hypothetical protein